MAAAAAAATAMGAEFVTVTTAVLAIATNVALATASVAVIVATAAAHRPSLLLSPLSLPSAVPATVGVAAAATVPAADDVARQGRT